MTLYTDGLGAGIFFIGYFLFEVPSSAILARVGARRWLARIVISWAILSGMTAFVQTAGQFYVVRFLIGAAEAGFAPGVIYCISTWFPNARRGRATSYLGTAIPIAFIIGAAVSGWILHSFAGSTIMKPWQWLFVLEAIPALVAGVAQPSAAAGLLSATVLIWALPTAMMHGATAAVGIAIVNSIGNLAGFVSPFAVGWLNVRTGRPELGMYLVSLVVAAVAVAAYMLPAKVVDK